MNPAQKFNFDTEVFHIKINWAAMLVFAAFWSYGYYGALTSNKIGFAWNAIISSVLYGIFLSYMFLWRKYAEYEDAISLTKHDIFAFFSYLAILLALSFGSLRNPLQGDQIFHAQYSQLQSMHTIFSLSRFIDIFDNYVFAHLLYVLNLTALILAAILCYAFRKRSFKARVIVLSAAFIFFRAVIWKFGGYPSGHPPLRFFPLWLSSSILSVNDTSFRLPQFLGLICLMTISRRLAGKKMGAIASWLFGLAIGTIPVLWHIGTLAVESIWTSIIYIILLLSIAVCEDFENFKWVRWTSLVSIFALLRQSAFVGLIPIFALFVFHSLGRRRFDIKNGIFMVMPIFVMAPLLVKSIIFGMPSSYIPGEADLIPKDASSLEILSIAITSGIAAKSILNSLTFAWLIFLPFAFIPLQRGFKNLSKPAANLLFFSGAFAIFYLVAASEWGTSKYQAEYAVPFATAGLFYFMVKLKEVRNAFFKVMIIAGLVPLIFFNVFLFENMYTMNNSGVIFETPYSYNEALKAVKKEGLAGHSIIVGSTYGVFTEILNGFTVSEVMQSRDIFKKVTKSAGLVDFGLLNDDPKIRIVLISDVSNSRRADLTSYLKTRNWKEWINFKNSKSGAVIYGLIKERRD